MAIPNPKPNTSSSPKNPSKKGASHLSGKGVTYLLYILALCFSLRVHAEEVRVVSLSPAITEVLFNLGLGKNIVGTSSFSSFPESAKNIPTVGSYLSPSIEKIIRLKPTHVLVFKEGDPSIEESLKKAKLNFVVLESRNLEDFENMVKELGNIFKVEKESKKILNTWTTDWSKLEATSRSKEKIMLQVDQSPIYIAGQDTFLSKSFERCGFVNAFDNLNGYKKVQLEAVMNRKPEIILVVGMLDQTGHFEVVKDFWKSNPATKNSKIIKGNGDILSRLSPRLPKEVIKICSQIKPLKASE